MNQELNKFLREESEKILLEEKNNQVFSNNEEANNLIKNIKKEPYAFLIGCLMDRQIKAEKAWEIPYQIKKEFNDLNHDTLIKIPLEEWNKLFQNKSLHRFNKEMPNIIYNAIKLIDKKYNGDPNNIWNDTDNALVIVKRFQEFKGIGQKIGTMAVNILRRDFKLPITDLRGIDISTDVQVMKVLYKFGIIDNINNKKMAIEFARKLNPDYPGIIDLTLWKIGRGEIPSYKYKKYEQNKTKMQISNSSKKNISTNTKNDDIFYYNANGGKGMLKRHGNKWIIIKGTKFALTPKRNFINKHGEKGRAKNLMPLRNKILETYCENNVLKEDYLISSPSLAGALIGYDSALVKRRWENAAGVSLSDIENKNC